MRLALGCISRTLIALLFIISTGSAQSDTLVMVVSSESNLAPLSRLELRKMFLGIPLNIDDERLKPLRNESDTSVIKQFHRLIVGMTEPSYNRKLMRNRLNYAADPPAAFKQQAALFYTLEQNKHAVSYTWLSALPPNDTSLKVLQVIWHQE